MTTEALPRLLLPSWLLRMLRPMPIPADWTRACAASVAVGAPQVVGLLTGRMDEAVLASVGALCASFSDLTGSYRYRLRRVGLAAILGALGFAAGAAAAGPWWAAAVVLAVSVPSVLSSRMGDLWSSGGAHMLTFCVVATGQKSVSLSLGAQVWWFFVGEFLLLAMVAATWPFHGTAPARGAVAAIFEATLRMFDGESPITARQNLTKALDNAHDVLVGDGSMARSRVRDRLYLVYTFATPIVEASVSLAHAGKQPPDRAREALRTLARCMRTGDVPPPYQPGADESQLVRALDQGIAELITAFRRAELPQPSGEQHERLQLSFGRSTWAQVCRMVLCLALAEGIGLVAGLDEPYWIALTVALVLKPNSGSVFARTVLRALGSVIGVLIALALLMLVPTGWWLLPFVVALAAKLPTALSRHYGLFSAVVTALVLLQMSQSEHFLSTVRLIDTIVGCAIVLVVGFLLRPLNRGPALPSRFADAVDAVSEYVSRSLAGVRHGRSALRRRTYRQLADLRAALQHQLMDPTAAAQAERWWPTIIVLERVVDAATEKAVLDGPQDLQEAQRLVSAMRTMTRQLRTTRVSPSELRGELERIYADVAGP
ncbi:FUSC family protein [Saccharopolyspora phatthalungensis]|uniref:Putative membrane protein YeaQ/YmgE (Transglycosylase-associated protein family) n=1 Tax=Saccharopolyspora phatthalungensis TaxID=664693 RepID=A0A840Q5W7_9PSEU|nr:FUSC family protein [Saccharopolyspora phatthalungensis]MBB5154069.1 putative membrane protein YeaQ/YmgE (transglycosylase-associated protein family) [Saccharopolyspora phatthalungensis]